MYKIRTPRSHRLSLDFSQCLATCCRTFIVLLLVVGCSGKADDQQEGSAQAEENLAEARSSSKNSEKTKETSPDTEGLIQVDGGKLITLIRSTGVTPSAGDLENLHQLAAKGNKSEIIDYMSGQMGMSEQQVQIVAAYTLNNAVPAMRQSQKDPENLPPPTVTTYGHPQAELHYLYGDIDNLGYGFPEGYDPYSGNATKPHRYPFYPDANDPPGTDKIMVISGYKGDPKTRKEGYTRNTSRPTNMPEALQLRYDLKNVQVNAATLLLFVDDFQAPTFKNYYQVSLNGERLPYAEEMINALRQGGPIGKMITLQLLPENLGQVRSGSLDLFIDDPLTDVGEGYAIDFAVLLINPRELPGGVIKGKVLIKRKQVPVEGAQVRSSGGQSTTHSAADGTFLLPAVPAGLAVVSASLKGYETASLAVDLVAGDTAMAVLLLEPKKEDAKTLAEQLEEKGKVTLYGINFDFDRAEIKPESEAVLQAVLALVKQYKHLKLEISGHTDASGQAAYNRKLSQDRAQAVVDWLKKQGAGTATLSARGYGATQPVASNETEEGREQNRRVEIRVLEK